jgi:hypothetical protein
MNLRRILSLVILLCIGCTTTPRTDSEKSYIDDKKLFVTYFSLNVSAHLSTYSELSVVEAVQHLERFQDIENAWIVDENNKLIAVLKTDGSSIGDLLKESWLLPEIARAKEAKAIMVIIRRNENRMIYTFISPLFDRVFKRYIGAAIIQYARRR